MTTAVFLVGARVARRIATGAPIVLVHGVGAGPSSFDATAEALADAHHVVVLHRPPVAGDGGTWDRAIDELADAVRTVAVAGPGATVVGVSGGATLALAMLIDHPDVAGAAILHEPLVGPLAPALHERVTSATARLKRGELSADRWLEGLVGERSWSSLAHSPHRTLVSTAEVDAFTTWAPTEAALATLHRLGPSRLVTTVGEASPPARHDAAAALHRLSGASVVTLAGAGHLPQLDRPAEFARVVRALTSGRQA